MGGWRGEMWDAIRNFHHQITRSSIIFVVSAAHKISRCVPYSKNWTNVSSGLSMILVSISRVLRVISDSKRGVAEGGKAS